MLAKLRRGFTGIEILVLGALIVSLITGTIATSDTAKKFLFKPKASGTSQCSLVGSDNQIGCWCAQGGWQFHCFDPNQPLPEGADAYDCGVKCKALDANDNPPPPPAPIDQPSQPSNPEPYGKNWGNACSDVPYGKCNAGFRCVGGDKYDYNYFKEDDTCKPEDEFKPIKKEATVDTTSSSENCASKPKPTYCDPQFEEAICVSGSWTCELIELEPKTTCSPNAFSNCVDSNTRKMMCNDTGTGYTYETCPTGQKCDFANKRCSVPITTTTQTTTETIPTCTSSGYLCSSDNKSLEYCPASGANAVKIKDCPNKCDPEKKDCKTAVTTAPVLFAIGSTCSNPNGTKLDNERYCCKGFVQAGSTCSVTTTTGTTGSTTPTYCQYIGQYFCSTNSKTQNYCFNPNSPPATTACPNNCNNDTGQCNTPINSNAGSTSETFEPSQCKKNYDQADCPADKYCGRTAPWDSWDCQSKRSSGDSCSNDNQCLGGKCSGFSVFKTCDSTIASTITPPQPAAEAKQDVPIFYNGWTAEKLFLNDADDKCIINTNCRKDRDEWFCYTSKNDCLKSLGVKPPLADVSFDTCSSSDPCPSRQYCDQADWAWFGFCKTLKPVGEICSKDKECASNFNCIDKKCQPPYPWCPINSSSNNCTGSEFSSSTTMACTSRDDFTTLVCCPPGQDIFSYRAGEPKGIERINPNVNIAFCLPDTCDHSGFKNGQFVCLDQ